MEDGDGGGPGAGSVRGRVEDVDVVADGVRGEDARDAARGEPLALHNLGQHRLRVVEQLLRLAAHLNGR